MPLDNHLEGQLLGLKTFLARELMLDLSWWCNQGIEFQSMERAESFYQSDEYRKGLKYINSEVADRFLNISEAVD